LAAGLCHGNVRVCKMKDGGGAGRLMSFVSNLCEVCTWLSLDTCSGSVCCFCPRPTVCLPSSHTHQEDQHGRNDQVPRPRDPTGPPGLAWPQGDNSNNTPVTRRYFYGTERQAQEDCMWILEGPHLVQPAASDEPLSCCTTG
jgi:hypothetical protein